MRPADRSVTSLAESRALIYSLRVRANRCWATARTKAIAESGRRLDHRLGGEHAVRAVRQILRMDNTNRFGARIAHHLRETGEVVDVSKDLPANT